MILVTPLPGGVLIFTSWVNVGSGTEDLLDLISETSDQLRLIIAEHCRERKDAGFD